MADTDDRQARQALLMERAAILADISTTTATLVGLRQLRADGFDDDEHDPDGAPLSSAVLHQEGLLRTAEERLVVVDAAMRLVDGGRYGVCEVCGRPIPAGRLAVRPAATRCVDCAERR